MSDLAPFRQLIAAAYTPFYPNGDLHLALVEMQAQRAVAEGVTGIFIAGTTGEGISLTTDERLRLTRRWVEVAQGRLRIIAHVASDCSKDACELARESQSLGVDAIAAMAPHYFRPNSIEELLTSMQPIAAAAPATPFFFYDIPALTRVRLPMCDFLEQGVQRMHNLKGLKYTNPDLYQFQKCWHQFADRLELFFGLDEALLAALAVGATGAVGSTYNFAAPIYWRMIHAFHQADLVTARHFQLQSVKLVTVLLRYGMPAAGKAVMSMIGIDCGPVRPPLTPLTPDRLRALERELAELGFFDWIRS
jgi:N-acetylneuraminate lyase